MIDARGQTLLMFAEVIRSHTPRERRTIEDKSRIME
jgi:hypothetical protein